MTTCFVLVMSVKWHTIWNKPPETHDDCICCMCRDVGIDLTRFYCIQNAAILGALWMYGEGNGCISSFTQQSRISKSITGLYKVILCLFKLVWLIISIDQLKNFKFYLRMCIFYLPDKANRKKLSIHLSIYWIQIKKDHQSNCHFHQRWEYTKH